MKKMYAGIIILLGLFLSTAAYADEGSQKEAEALLKTLHMDTLLGQSMDQMLALQIQQNPAMAPYRTIMDQFLKKYMSYESLKPDMIKLYAQTFSTQELKDLNAFYQTPTGQKAIQTMPQLMAQGAQIGNAKVQEHLPELQQQIQAEAARLQQMEQEKQTEAAPKK